MANPKTRLYSFLVDAVKWDTETLSAYFSSIHMPVCVSPVHTPDDGEPFLHRHVVVEYPSPVVLSTARSDFENIALNDYVEPVRSRKSMLRYFLHLDDPDKEQLEADEVLTFGGFLFDTTPDLTADDILKYQIEIQQFIRENNVTEYSDLCNYCLDIGNLNWYRVATSKTIFWRAYLASSRHKFDLQ